MRFLVDNCVPASVGRWLAEHGHDVRLVSEMRRDPGDAVLLQMAADEQRVMLTNDTDFGVLIFRDAMPHTGLIRLPQLISPTLLTTLDYLLIRYEKELYSGAVLTVQGDKVRVTRTGQSES